MAYNVLSRMTPASPSGLPESMGSSVERLWPGMAYNVLSRMTYESPLGLPENIGRGYGLAWPHHFLPPTKFLNHGMCNYNNVQYIIIPSFWAQQVLLILGTIVKGPFSQNGVHGQHMGCCHGTYNFIIFFLDVYCRFCSWSGRNFIKWCLPTN